MVDSVVLDGGGVGGDLVLRVNGLCSHTHLRINF